MVTIRIMQISDYEQVIALWGKTENLSLRDSDSKENIAAYLERNPGLSFVALSEETVIGAALVGTDGRRGYLQHLAVSEQCRGQGIGRLLVQQVTEALAKAGISKTHLFVYQSNRNAQYFYENLGWFPRDEIRMYSYNSSENLNV